MNTDTGVIGSRGYPDLFATQHWGPLQCSFELCDEAPAALVSNVNVIAFAGSGCVVLALDSGEWEVPGGTLEPGETYSQALRRELLEEAGAELLSFSPFGAWRCHSSAPRPYRAHLPHPESYRLVGYGEVRIFSTPAPVAGGEKVAAVALLPPDEAARRFAAIGRPDLADLYRLAAGLREAAVNG